MILLDALRAAVAGYGDLWQAHVGASLRGRRNQAVFHGDDPSDAIYLLLEGKARAWVGEPRREQTTLLLRAPAVFGDRDLLADTPAHETVELLTAGRLLVWEKEAVQRELAESSPLQRWLWCDLAGRYRAAIALAALWLAPIEERVAALWRDHLIHHGSPPENRLLARITSTTEKSVARALATLRRQGVLTTRGGLPDDGSGSPPFAVQDPPQPLFHSLTQPR